MKEIVKVSFSIKVEANNVISKRVADPIVSLLEKSVPLIERAGQALVKDLENENKKEGE